MLLIWLLVSASVTFASYLSPTAITNPSQYCFAICNFQLLYSMVPLREYILKCETCGSTATLLKLILRKLKQKENITKSDLDQTLDPLGFAVTKTRGNFDFFSHIFSFIQMEERAKIGNLFSIQKQHGLSIEFVPRISSLDSRWDFEEILTHEKVAGWPPFLMINIMLTNKQPGLRDFTTRIDTSKINHSSTKNYSYQLYAMKTSNGSHSTIWFKEDLSKKEKDDTWIHFDDARMQPGIPLDRIPGYVEKTFVFVREDYISVMINGKVMGLNNDKEENLADSVIFADLHVKQTPIAESVASIDSTAEESTLISNRKNESTADQSFFAEKPSQSLPTQYQNTSNKDVKNEDSMRHTSWLYISLLMFLLQLI